MSCQTPSSCQRSVSPVHRRHRARLGAGLGVLLALGATVAQPSIVSAQSASQQALEVTVHRVSAAQQLRRSAEAVAVVDTTAASLESADLGEVLGRTPGVSVRRVGGLGSAMRLSLNGLQNEQVRIFLDGVPLDLLGYASGLANVPLSLVRRVEIYSGVVPIRFGADALGGAINLVGPLQLSQLEASASLQLGSFGTRRFTAGIETLDAPTGVFVRANGFSDRADNDYPVNIELTDELGKQSSARVRRFHDAYRAEGVGVELGVIGKAWADQLSLRVFLSDYQREIQNNADMSVPYGEPTMGRLSVGGQLRYDQTWGHDWLLHIVAGTIEDRSRFVDVGLCVYNWLGICVREGSIAGEAAQYRGNNGSDQVTERSNQYLRGSLEWLPDADYALRLAVAPTSSSQSGEERRLTELARDPLAVKSTLQSIVSGVEYEQNWLGERVTAVTFGKHYFQRLDTVRNETTADGRAFEKLDSTARRFGVGTSWRAHIFPWLLGKFSYEWATRLPRSEEVLGNNANIVPSPELKPELSQNFNLEAFAEFSRTAIGDFKLGTTGFWRELSDVVVRRPLFDGYHSVHENVLSARASGFQAHASWISPGSWLSISGNLTRQKVINTSTKGQFKNFQGAELPNRPSLYGNLEARWGWHDFAQPADELSLSARTHWVDEFFLGWGAVGRVASKPKVPTQLLHSLTAVYSSPMRNGSISLAAEAHNLGDQRAFDFYGVQKPGRAFYAKLSAHL